MKILIFLAFIFGIIFLGLGLKVMLVSLTGIIYLGLLTFLPEYLQDKIVSSVKLNLIWLVLLTFTFSVSVIMLANGAIHFAVVSLISVANFSRLLTLRLFLLINSSAIMVGIYLFSLFMFIIIVPVAVANVYHEVLITVFPPKYISWFIFPT